MVWVVVEFDWNPDEFVVVVVLAVALTEELPVLLFVVLEFAVVFVVVFVPVEFVMFVVVLVVVVLVVVVLVVVVLFVVVLVEFIGVGVLGLPRIFELVVLLLPETNVQVPQPAAVQLLQEAEQKLHFPKQLS